MGRTALRRVIDHPDLELAGVYVYDPRKVGVDAGDIARRPVTGVRATNRIEDIIAVDREDALELRDAHLVERGALIDAVGC